MKLVLYSLNYEPELTGIGKYNGEMARYFACKGLDVSAIVGYPYYPEWKIHKGFRKYRYTSEEKEGVSIVRCPLYVPKKISNIKRVIHLLSFSITSTMALLVKSFSKPDIIFVVQPTLFCAPIALIFAKLTGAKAVMHIQDFELDAMLSLQKSGPQKMRFISIIKRIELWLLCKFDMVSTISEGMLNHAIHKGIPIEKLKLFPNWCDLDFVTPKIDGNKLKSEWGVKDKEQIVLYSGNIGLKQGLSTVIEVAKRFQTKENVKFIFVGTGVFASKLKLLVNEQNLNNVLIFPLQPWKRVPEMLAMANVHLVIQKKHVSDLVMPSKLTNILAAGGHAIVTAEKNTELEKISRSVEGVYLCIEPEDVEKLTQAISDLLSRDTKQKNSIAREYAERNLEKTRILDNFSFELEKLCNPK